MLSLAAGVVLGLLVGSFLNVVIYRLPIMLDREWRRQCQELAAATSGPDPVAVAVTADPTFNLLTPRSRCPGCGSLIRAWQNVPVLSWLWLRGRCAACGTSISARYPLVELITALLSGLVVWQFGTGLAGAALLLLTWGLIALTVIDLDHQLLPDAITYPLLWLGLLTSAVMTGNLPNPFPELQSAVIGAAAGYLVLWSIYWVFKLITGKEGMGHGDFKLLAVLGAWLGYELLPLVILLSALSGALVGVALIAIQGRDRQMPLPFGPFLATAGLLALLWGSDLVDAYLNFARP